MQAAFDFTSYIGAAVKFSGYLLAAKHSPMVFTPNCLHGLSNSHVCHVKCRRTFAAHLVGFLHILPISKSVTVCVHSVQSLVLACINLTRLTPLRQDQTRLRLCISTMQSGAFGP